MRVRSRKHVWAVRMPFRTWLLYAVTGRGDGVALSLWVGSAAVGRSLRGSLLDSDMRKLRLRFVRSSQRVSARDARSSVTMLTSGEHTAQALIESQVAAFSRGDVDAVLEHFTEHCVLVVGTERVPLHGRAAVRDYLDRLCRELPCATVRINSVVGGGSEAVAEVELRGRWTDEAMEVASVGGVRQVRARVSVTLQDGRIREQRIDPEPADDMPMRRRRASRVPRVAHFERR
jgi:ketosteroid isomerase-like protein